MEVRRPWRCAYTVKYNGADTTTWPQLYMHVHGTEFYHSTGQKTCPWIPSFIKVSEQTTHQDVLEECSSTSRHSHAKVEGRRPQNGGIWAREVGTVRHEGTPNEPCAGNSTVCTHHHRSLKYYYTYVYEVFLGACSRKNGKYLLMQSHWNELYCLYNGRVNYTVLNSPRNTGTGLVRGDTPAGLVLICI